ncbi:hypothetical protein C8R47DRAFT_1216012 [Mycena vitilis]|nr:hypothetical protein C8R47DRAFT_1216012 [Mycena vitilis]
MELRADFLQALAGCDGAMQSLHTTIPNYEFMLKLVSSRKAVQLFAKYIFLVLELFQATPRFFPVVFRTLDHNTSSSSSSSSSACCDGHFVKFELTNLLANWPRNPQPHPSPMHMSPASAPCSTTTTPPATRTTKTSTPESFAALPFPRHLDQPLALPATPRAGMNMLDVDPAQHATVVDLSALALEQLV